MIFGESQKGKTVAVVGMLQNNSDQAWKDAQVEVRFFDPQGKLIDTETGKDYVYRNTIPPHGEKAFKVYKVVNYPTEKYASYKVFVRFAEDARKFP
jgi:hypothetical protein